MNTNVENTKIQYEISQDGLILCGMSVQTPNVDVPDTIDGMKVVEISKRAFFNSVTLKSVSLPGTIQRIGAWAFAKCPNLTKVCVRPNGYERVIFEKGVFDGCKKLADIMLGFETMDSRSSLLAIAASLPNTDFLLNDDEIAKPSWYKKFDLKLLAFLNSDDYEGITENVLCGEEDISYDDVGMIDGELPSPDKELITKARIEKCYFAMHRLQNSDFLNSDDENKIKQYLIERAFGMPNPAAWLLLKDSHRSFEGIWEKYVEIVPLDRDRIIDMIGDLNEEQVSLKSFLIGYSAKLDSKDSFFDTILL